MKNKENKPFSVRDAKDLAEILAHKEKNEPSGTSLAQTAAHECKIKFGGAPDLCVSYPQIFGRAGTVQQ